MVEWGLAGQQIVERGPQVVDAQLRRSQVFEPAARLLGAHGDAGVPTVEPGRVLVAGRVDRSARPHRPGPEGSARVLIHELGQAPVDDEGLTMQPEHDVTRLQVAMEDPLAVGVVDGVADVVEPPQQGRATRPTRSPGAWIGSTEEWNRSMAAASVSLR